METVQGVTSGTRLCSILSGDPCVTSKKMNMLNEWNSSTKNDCYYVISVILWVKGDISCRQRGVEED